MAAGGGWLGRRQGWYGLVVVGIAATVGAVDYLFGPGACVLTLAFLALASAIGWLWSSLLALRSDAPLTLDEALALVVPTAEEEKKQAVLRALKDLEYERAVGKISADDYATLVQRYRREAKELLYVIDRGETASLEAAETKLRARLEAEGLPVARPGASSS